MFHRLRHSDSTVGPTLPVEPNKDMTDNFSHQRKISPKKERWDAPLSSRKEPPRYTLFKNQTYMERRGENEYHDEVRNDEEEGEIELRLPSGFLS